MFKSDGNGNTIIKTKHLTFSGIIGILILTMTIIWNVSGWSFQSKTDHEKLQVNIKETKKLKNEMQNNRRCMKAILRQVNEISKAQGVQVLYKPEDFFNNMEELK